MKTTGIVAGSAGNVRVPSRLDSDRVPPWPPHPLRSVVRVPRAASATTSSTRRSSTSVSRATSTQVGGHRQGSRDRLDRALSLLRVQAGLPATRSRRSPLQADRAKFDTHRSPSTTTSQRRSTAVLDSAFELTDHEVLRNRVLVAEQSLAGLHRTSAREEEARATRPLADARPRVRLGDLPHPRHGAERHPAGRPAPARARDPRPLQQRLALVPAARQPLSSTRSASSSSPAAWPSPACRSRCRRRQSASPRRSARARSLMGNRR